MVLATMRLVATMVVNLEPPQCQSPQMVGEGVSPLTQAQEEPRPHSHWHQGKLIQRKPDGMRLTQPFKEIMV